MTGPLGDSELFVDAALASLENVHRLQSSAKAAASVGNFGHGCSLLILSMEELGKAIGYRLCAEGWARIEGKGKSQEFVVSIPIVGEKRFWLYGHADKRDVTTGLGLLFLIPFFAMILLYLSKVPVSSTPAPSEVSVPGETGTEPTALDLLEFRELDALRESGLYVEIKEGSIASPNAITSGKFERLNRLVSGYVSASEDAVRIGIVSELVKTVKEAWIRFQKMLDDSDSHEKGRAADRGSKAV